VTFLRMLEDPRAFAAARYETPVRGVTGADLLGAVVVLVVVLPRAGKISVPRALRMAAA